MAKCFDRGRRCWKGWGGSLGLQCIRSAEDGGVNMMPVTVPSVCSAYAEGAGEDRRGRNGKIGAIPAAAPGQVRGIPSPVRTEDPKQRGGGAAQRDGNPCKMDVHAESGGGIFFVHSHFSNISQTFRKCLGVKIGTA